MKKRPAFRFGPATTQWPFSLEAALLIAVMALASIGLFALVGLPYTWKFLWSPIIDRVPLPILSEHVRGWIELQKGRVE